LIVFDTETNGLLDTLTTIHCLHLGDPDTGQQWRYSSLPGADGTVEDGLRRLMEEPVIGGHNVHRFDVPAIRKVYPWFEPKGYVWDTLALASLVWPKDVLKERDGKLQKKGKLPAAFFEKGYFAGQQLGAWGYRLGLLKGEYDSGWETLTPEMDDYCAQDVAVTMELWRRIVDNVASAQSAYIENEVLRIIAAQERHGFCFDVDAARALEADLLARKAELDAQLRAAFKPWWTRDGGPKQSHRCPKRTQRRWEEIDGQKVRVTYTEGAAYTKVKLKLFNPASRADIANRLQRLYGWVPKVFTDSGQPEISEETLDGMDFPEAPLLKEYLMVDKRLGQLSTGKQAWLSHVKEDGRIHGRVNTNQAITGRMTHAFPNIAQVPRVGTLYGKECRALFYAPLGWLLVGCDAEGLELRCLGHFMARYDGGTYAETVVNGKKEDGTDVHTVNKRAVGLNSRDSAKTFIYALIYGGGDVKLGIIIIENFPEEQRRKWLNGFKSEEDREKAYRKLGSKARDRIMRELPALGQLVDAVSLKVGRNGFLRGIDGRKLPIRKRHAALNTLLQSAGAIVMKLALILAERAFVERGLVIGRDLAFVANVHDEFQIEAREEIAGEVGEIAADAIRRAGECFGFRCPLAGSADTGRTWADTH
jgi:DNA polymerase I-like protein with 3'-5' exonuclease and polymerase domains